MDKLLYEVIYEDGSLYGISLVDAPANGFDFVLMKEQVKKKIELKADKKKQILYGIVLRANQEIIRTFEDGTEYFLRFPAEVIEQFSQDFIIKGYQANTSFNHEKEKGWLDGTSVVEQWIVQDPENDKGNAIGLSVEKSDWVVGMKLSDELWKEYIETGKAVGFSIDSFVGFKRINYKITGDLANDKGEEKIEKNNMSLIKKFFELLKSEEIKFASIEVEGLGTLTADEFTEGNVVSKDEEIFAGEFTYENKLFVTDPAGVIISITEVEEKEEEAPEEVPEEVPEEAKELKEEIVEKVVEEIKEEVKEVEMSEMEKSNIEMISEIKTLKEENGKIKLEMEELKKQPVSEKIKSRYEHVSPINYKEVNRSDESMLSVIERVRRENKKINKQ